MKSLLALGVTQLSDAYPNIKYKLELLARLKGFDCSEQLCILNNEGTDSTSFSASTGHAGICTKLLLGLKILFGHVWLSIHCTLRRPDYIYVTYPGILLTCILAVPGIRKRQSKLYLDAFISLYDTVVNDRKLLPQRHPLARLLFRVEKRAFASATRVLVDTEENALFYSQLFQLPKHQFVPLALSIPELPITKQHGSHAVTDEKAEDPSFRCIFVGTFVPLQGVQVIIDAAKQLQSIPSIEFVFIGDGQDALHLETHLQNETAKNIIWHRGHFVTEFVIREIAAADICLGIFAVNDKTQRVLPYKLYYYLALGMPILTAHTATIDRLLARCKQRHESPPFITTPAGNANALAEQIVALANDQQRVTMQGIIARQFFEHQLSTTVIQQQLLAIFDDKSSVH
jgi:glycosyltransferase involved in cell wall biosynthesis